MKQWTDSSWVLSIALLVFGCSSAPSREVEPQAAVPQEVSSGPVEGKAELFVLNISGATLIASNMDVTDNGSLIVSLPRATYKSIQVAPGAHEFRFKDFPKGPRVAKVDAVTGQTYYLAVGYSPGKSWALGIAGDPMQIKVVTEQDARNWMKGMKAQ